MTVFERMQSYVASGDIEPVWEDREVFIWIDWREEDVDLVNYFKEHIKTEDFEGMESGTHNVNVRYKGQTHTINYSKDYADRDTTLIGLNEIISDEYEIRFAIQTNGSDTLAFSILKNKDWDILEKQFGATLNKYYKKLTRGEAIFGS